MRPGPQNLITDVPGFLVGNAEDAALKSGVTVLTSETPFVAGVHIMGGAPGTRETELLSPERLVQTADALVLSGGSAFGLDAASGVSDALRDLGRGFPAAGCRVPIVPGAILFDLQNGGNKDWGDNPYRALGRAAFEAASTPHAIGSAGAGTGATVRTLMGGLGSASVTMDGGLVVGALVAVNAHGNVTVGDGPHFWAAPFEIDDEFGGFGCAPVYPAVEPAETPHEMANTTIAIIATNAKLTQAEATQMAVVAHDGMARAIVPSHTPFDGDLVFTAASGEVELTEPARDQLWLGHAAATCLARAIARGVYAATPAAGNVLPTWSEKFDPG